jgi:hypothetical protein
VHVAAADEAAQIADFAASRPRCVCVFRFVKVSHHPNSRGAVSAQLALEQPAQIVLADNDRIVWTKMVRGQNKLDCEPGSDLAQPKDQRRK